jgi:hypothetical protein
MSSTSSAHSTSNAENTYTVDVEKMVSDFEYYCHNLLMIRTKDAGFRRFNAWWPSQRHLWRTIKSDILGQQPVRKIVLKARQQGISTLTEAIMFWRIHTSPNMHALVLSQDRDSASTIFEMARNFYESIPEELRPMKRYSSKKELVLENPDEKTRPTHPGMRSRIEVQTAGKFTPPRGSMFQQVHFSEVAFWPNPEDIVPAIIPMVPDLQNTMILYESTGNGKNNFFYEEWQKAKLGRSAFEPLFIPWFVMPEYSMLFRSPEELEEMRDTLDEEEEQLIELHKVTLEQLKWRRFKIAALGDDMDRFYQEYPSTEDEAFIYGGTPIFDIKSLRKVRTREPIWVGDIIGSTLTEDDDGLLSIWEHPQPHKEYVIGVDVAGGEGDDYSCMCILKKTHPHGLCEQVAEWHGKVDPVMLGQLCVHIAHYYNDAMLSIELNNHGLTTQVEAQRNYWNFYRWQYFDRIGRTYTQKVGWVTSMNTKPILVDRTRACLRDGLVGISSEGLLQELFNYVRIPDSMSFGAEFGNDDRVMAFMIGLTTLYIDDPNAVYEELGTTLHIQKPEDVQLVVPVQVYHDRSDPRGYTVKSSKNWMNL